MLKWFSVEQYDASHMFVGTFFAGKEKAYLPWLWMNFCFTGMNPGLWAWSLYWWSLLLNWVWLEELCKKTKKPKKNKHKVVKWLGLLEELSGKSGRTRETYKVRSTDCIKCLCVWSITVSSCIENKIESMLSVQVWIAKATSAEKNVVILYKNDVLGCCDHRHLFGSALKIF